MSTKTKKEDDYTLEEKKAIEAQRANKQRIKDCSEEIAKVLEKNKATLVVNPQSPIGQPQIMVKLIG